MNTAIAGNRGRYQRRRAAQRGLSDAERMGVSHEEFVQPGDVVTVTASASAVTSGDLIVAAASPVLDPIGTAMKAGRHLGRDGAGVA